MRLFSIAALILLLSACGGSQPAMQFPPPVVGVAHPLARDLPLHRACTGRIEPIHLLEVAPRVGGTILSIPVRSGRSVQAGDALFEIDPAPFQAALERVQSQVAEAEARLRLAVDQRERNAGMLAQKLVAQQVYDDSVTTARAAEAGLAGARASLVQAQLERDWCTVRAPIAGTLGLIQATVGSQVIGGGMMPATVLTSLISSDPVYVGFDLDETTFHRLADRLRASVRGDTPVAVRVGLPGAGDHPWQGKIVFVDNHVDPATGTIRLRALVTGTEGKLPAGGYARVLVETEPPRPVVLVHAQAIQAQLATRYVLTVGQGGVTAFRPVQVGQAHGDLREVTGVAPTDTVVVTNLAKVFFPGMPVSPQPVAMDTLAAAEAAK